MSGGVPVHSVTLPWPSSKLTPHAKGHWRPKADATKAAKAIAHALCLEKPAIKAMPDARIFVEYYPKAYRGDVHNMHGLMKAYIDGVAQAMGCDDKDFRVDFPAVWAGKSPNGKVIFRIEQPLDRAK